MRPRQIAAEIAKVKWPSRNQALQLMAYVVIICVILSLMIVASDFVFTELRNIILES